jgi:two-component system, LytTR family, response regulator
MIKIGICDDEPDARRVVLKYIERYFELFPKEEYSILFNVAGYGEALELTLQHQPDILFLDIHLKDGNGIDMAKEMEGKSKTKIIFTTAFNEYAIEALRLRAFDYLMKPLDTEEFNAAMTKILPEIRNQKMQRTGSAKISVTTLSGIELIEADKIIYFQAQTAYCKIYIIDKPAIVISKPLSFIEKQIQDNNSFLKIHRSFIVNVRHVQFLNRKKNELVLKNGIGLPIARANLKKVFDHFGAMGLQAGQ